MDRQTGFLLKTPKKLKLAVGSCHKPAADQPEQLIASFPLSNVKTALVLKPLDGHQEATLALAPDTLVLSSRGRDGELTEVGCSLQPFC